MAAPRAVAGRLRGAGRASRTDRRRERVLVTISPALARPSVRSRAIRRDACHTGAERPRSRSHEPELTEPDMTVVVTKPHPIFLAGRWVESPDVLVIDNPADPNTPAGATFTAT